MVSGRACHGSIGKGAAEGSHVLSRDTGVITSVIVSSICHTVSCVCHESGHNGVSNVP